MKPLSFNMSKFKKIAGDKHSTTMQHDDGHTITIAHASLPAIQRKQLEKMPMADGGEVKGVHKSDMEIESPKNKMEKKWAGESSAGRHVGETDLYGSSATKKAKGQHHRVLGEMKSMPNPKLQGLADGGNVQPTKPSPTPVLDSSKLDAVKQGFLGATHYADGSDSVQQFEGSDSQPQTAAPAPAPGILTPNGLSNAPAAIGLEQKAIQQQSAIDQAKGAQAADIEKGYNDAQAQILSEQRDRYSEYKKHVDDFAGWMKDNQVDPNHFAENRTSPQKVAGALGLFLGGFAPGGQNPAMDFLNKQIDRDIHAQTERVGQAKSVYDAYKQLYGDSATTYNLTKASMMDIYNHKLQRLAAQMATPQARAAANHANAILSFEKDQYLKQASQNPAIPTAYNQGSQDQAPAAQPSNTPADIINRAMPGQKPQGPQASAIPGFTPTHIVTPNANQAVYGAKVAQVPGWEDSEKVEEQLGNAQQLEKVLNGPKGDGVGSIHDYFNQLYTNSGEGNAITGFGGAVQRAGSKVTNAASHLLGGRGTDLEIPAFSNATKSYETNIQNVKTALASSLKGLISVNDLDKMLDKYAPGYGDSQELRTKKERDFTAELVRSLKLTNLDRHNLTLEKHK